MKIHKLYIVMLGFVCTMFISANNSYAEDKKVHLSIPHNMNALITYGHCRVNSKVKDKKIIVLNAIIEKEKSRVNNLFDQNKICSDNSTIYKNQAKEWKEAFIESSEELKKAKDWPWYKFDLKSVITGTLIPLIIKFAWL